MTAATLDLSYLKPMLCGSADSPPVGPRWIAEPKLDGWRFIVHVADDGVHAYGGRNASDYSGCVPYLEQSLIALPAGTVLDGELMHTLGFDAVGSVMRSNVAHVPTPGDPPMTYVVFDMLAVAGRNMRHMPWEDRRQVVETLADGLPHVQVPRYYELGTPNAAQAALKAALDDGYEGLVCKDRRAAYVHVRSQNWLKVKPQQTADARVIGFKASKTRPGLVGALEVELLANGVKTTIKCPSDEAQQEATHHPERWLGKVIEFDHHGLNATSGVPRHPTRARRRDDLAPAPKRPARVPSSAQAPGQNPANKPRGWSKRNYGAMHDAKLRGCIEELQLHSGDAYQRCIAKGGDPEADLAVAWRVAEGRGIRL